jgi:pyridoxine 5-phosphate synthase
MSIALHVNIDHVATLRQARGTPYPDPVEAAFLCERAGADGITAHLREDRRHIQDRDVRLLRQSVRGTFNLEMAATDEMIAIAREVRPDHVTLVPERRGEQTTEGGLEVAGAFEHVAQAVQQLKEREIRVSLFIAAQPAQIDAAARAGADQIELHTGEYANAHRAARDAHVLSLAAGARRAVERGMRVAAGHGLTVENVPAVAAIREVVELNIGHALVADAVMVGMHRAVRAMRRAMARARWRG